MFYGDYTGKQAFFIITYTLLYLYSDLYSTASELTPAILDTLGNLTLPPESLAEVHHSVLKTLNAAMPEQLPVVVKFLLSNTQSSVAYQVSTAAGSELKFSVYVLYSNIHAFTSSSPFAEFFTSWNRLQSCLSSCLLLIF